MFLFIAKIYAPESASFLNCVLGWQNYKYIENNVEVYFSTDVATLNGLTSNIIV